MAGIGKYKKGAKFTLKSGNKPSFTQMGSSPADLNNFGIGPGGSPYRQDDGKTDETPKNTTREQGGDAEKADPTWLKAIKLGTTMLSGGIQGVYGGRREIPKINWGKKTKKSTETPAEGIVSSILGEVYELGDLAKKEREKGTVGVKGSNIRGTLTKDYKKSKTNIKGSL